MSFFYLRANLTFLKLIELAHFLQLFDCFCDISLMSFHVEISIIICMDMYIAKYCNEECIPIEAKYPLNVSKFSGLHFLKSPFFFFLFFFYGFDSFFTITL